MAPAERVGAGKLLEAAYWPQPLFEVAVVSLQAIIEVLGALMLCAGEDSTNSGRIASRFVGYDTFWHCACPSDRAFEESPRRSGVAPLAEVGVHDLAILIDRPITVSPSALETTVRFIHAPLPAYWHSVRAGNLQEERQEALYPAVNCASGYRYTAFGEPFSDIRVTQPIPYIPSNGQGDQIVWKAVA